MNLIHVLYFAFSQRWAIAPPHDKFSKTAMSCKMPALTAILTRYITQYTNRSIWVNKVHNIITTYVPKEFLKRCYLIIFLSPGSSQRVSGRRKVAQGAGYTFKQIKLTRIGNVNGW